MTIVESTRPVTGGDTHLDQHVAAALDRPGTLLGVESFPATTSGYRDLRDWLAGFGEVVAVGVEGTGSYGVGLARFLHRSSVKVVEVDRPNRQVRRRHGKTDPLARSKLRWEPALHRYARTPTATSSPTAPRSRCRPSAVGSSPSTPSSTASTHSSKSSWPPPHHQEIITMLD